MSRLTRREWIRVGFVLALVAMAAFCAFEAYLLAYLNMSGVTSVGQTAREFQNRANKYARLWIFFGPVLPLPARQIDKTTVTFTVAENEQATVASGELEVQRTTDAEHVLWRFDSPNSARGSTFITGVNLIPTSREQAKCVKEDCSNVRMRQIGDRFMQADF